MIVRCALCKGQMKLDEASLPDRPRIKVRCPHCQGIGYVERPALYDTTLENDTAVQAASDSFGTTAEFRRKELGFETDSHEPSVPTDAFKEFHFPSEKRDEPQVHESRSRGRKILLWAVISLAVVAFFALIVNIVLPGPSGGQGMLRAVQPHESVPRSLDPGKGHFGR